ncbi:phage tail domain-containing protein [Staphylococcus petrasii]|uniref:phage tail domain-containing protein n=1 Tax=Staphylococcus petrasii TaxID=1276936 RepID=UPI001F584BA2|nr:phage tail domain-containing protein [Staphylococcus petrasii]MCI2773409.1 phage tail family protein [Staphylococcus petrasii]
MGFKLYNPNMNEVYYPVGVTPLDFLVSSISKERYTSSREGKPGNVDYGFDYKDRDITLQFYLEHAFGEHDYLLMRDEINALFDSYEYFYVINDDLPTRRLKVTFNDSFTPERIKQTNMATLEVKATILGHPFFQTIYTTQEIEQYGYTAIVEKFGLADRINMDLPNYSFTTNTFSVWNGGNVWIDYRNMDLKIIVKNLKTSGNFQIQNLTTQDTFIYKEKIDGKDLVLNGPLIYVGENNMLRNTNRKFIRLGPTKNDFKIINGTFDSIDFDFRYHFK